MSLRTQFAKPKPLTYELVDVDSEAGRSLYALLGELVEKHHEHLSRTDARIALAWCTSWKPDVDGHVTLGKCVKASDLHRELAPYDFVILLSRSFFESAYVTPRQREALIDHELCHAQVKYGPDGEPCYDARGRVMFRTRKHDLEEFSEIGERYGCWKKDIEVFFGAVARAQHRDPRYWIGANTVREALRAAGLTVPLEAIASWSKPEQAEALEWATLRVELATLPGMEPIEPPAHVSSALLQEAVS